MKNLAIIGASYLQLPLIKKAKEMGYITHVFAWAANDVGEKEADYFYPISIVEKEIILNKCKEIGIEGICSIASDLAMITVNYVSQNMGLISNSLECTKQTTNKYLMRKCFSKLHNGKYSPKSVLVNSTDDINIEGFDFPLIVKPIDRSGSRGITKVYKYGELENAINNAIKESFDKQALIEEYAEGNEYSVECISWNGDHHLLQITQKYTTGSPNYIETGHLEPAILSDDIRKQVQFVIYEALNVLKVEYGASHSEVKIDADGNIKIIEIGARMGGDLIGSNLVKLTTGIDFVEEVVNVAVGKKPNWTIKQEGSVAAVRFIFDKTDFDVLEIIKKENPELIVDYYVDSNIDEKVSDSSNRHGYYLMRSDSIDNIIKYMPEIK